MPDLVGDERSSARHSAARSRRLKKGQEPGPTSESVRCSSTSGPQRVKAGPAAAHGRGSFRPPGERRAYCHGQYVRIRERFEGLMAATMTGRHVAAKGVAA